MTIERELAIRFFEADGLEADIVEAKLFNPNVPGLEIKWVQRGVMPDGGDNAGTYRASFEQMFARINNPRPQ